MATSGFIFISDAGHGWLQVLPNEIRALGLEDQISEYSYYNPETNLVYLEEDCDAPLFLNAYRAKYGDEIQFKETHVGDEWIGRTRYERYNVTYPA